MKQELKSPIQEYRENVAAVDKLLVRIHSTILVFRDLRLIKDYLEWNH